MPTAMTTQRSRPTVATANEVATEASTTTLPDGNVSAPAYLRPTPGFSDPFDQCRGQEGADDARHGPDRIMAEGDGPGGERAHDERGRRPRGG